MWLYVQKKKTLFFSGQKWSTFLISTLNSIILFNNWVGITINFNPEIQERFNRNQKVNYWNHEYVNIHINTCLVERDLFMETILNNFELFQD